jgi:hypothetical protein
MSASVPLSAKLRTLSVYETPVLTDERSCAWACTIATHAPKKVRHAARQSVANIIRSNLLLCIAISIEPIPKFRLAQVVSRPSPTQ